MIRAFHRFTRGAFFVGALVLILAMTAVITVDVVGRYLFGAPLSGGQDIVGMALFMLFVLILPYSFRGDYHVRMDLIYGVLPGWARGVADLCGGAAAAIFAAALVYQAYVNIPHFYRVGSGTLNIKIPYWPFNVLLLAAAAVMLISVVLTVFKHRNAETDEA